MTQGVGVLQSHTPTRTTQKPRNPPKQVGYFRDTYKALNKYVLLLA